MVFAEFSTLPEPTQRSGYALSIPQLFFLRFVLKARGHTTSLWLRRRESHARDLIWRFAFILETGVESFK
jgi:hypothetical protein